MVQSDWSRESALAHTRLFIECANGAILLVDDNTPLVHKTGLLDVITGQVDGGESRLRGRVGGG